MTTRNNRYPTLTPAPGSRDDHAAVLAGLKAIARVLAINQAEIDTERLGLGGEAAEGQSARKREVHDAARRDLRPVLLRPAE